MHTAGVARLTGLARPGLARRHAPTMRLLAQSCGAAGPVGARRAWDAKRLTLPTVAAAHVHTTAASTDPVSTRRVPLRDGFSGRTRVKDIKVGPCQIANWCPSRGSPDAQHPHLHRHDNDSRCPPSLDASRTGPCAAGVLGAECNLTGSDGSGASGRAVRTRACPTSARHTRCAGGCAPCATRRRSRSWTSTTAPRSRGCRRCCRYSHHAPTTLTAPTPYRHSAAAAFLALPAAGTVLYAATALLPYRPRYTASRHRIQCVCCPQCPAT